MGVRSAAKARRRLCCHAAALTVSRDARAVNAYTNEEAAGRPQLCNLPVLQMCSRPCWRLGKHIARTRSPAETQMDIFMLPGEMELGGANAMTATQHAWLRAPNFRYMNFRDVSREPFS